MIESHELREIETDGNGQTAMLEPGGQMLSAKRTRLQLRLHMRRFCLLYAAPTMVVPLPSAADPL